MAATQTITPITILTGYLGAGKTTLLNRILTADHQLRVAVLVNDFGAVNIDSKLVVNVEGEMISLANGCICCTIRGDLVEAVQTLLNRPEAPEYILIEASGISDPAQVIITFNRSALRTRINVDSIITILDTEQFSEIVGKPERLIRDQLRVADIVILNKIDLVTPEQIQRSKKLINYIVPKARILESVHCELPLDLLLGVSAHNPQWGFLKSEHGVHMHSVDEDVEHEHHDGSLVFGTLTWTSSLALDLQKFRQAVDSLPVQVYRAKGILFVQDVPSHRVILQMVGKRVSLLQGETWGTETPNSQVVLIGDHDVLKNSNLRLILDQSHASAFTIPSISPFIDGVLHWLRLK